MTPPVIALVVGCVVFAAGLIVIVIAAINAPYGVQTPQGFRQLDSSDAPDDLADALGIGGGEVLFHSQSPIETRL